MSQLWKKLNVKKVMTLAKEKLKVKTKGSLNRSVTKNVVSK